MRTLLVIAALAFGLEQTNAQEGAWTFNYVIGMPMADTKEFIDQTSFRGFSIDGRTFIDGENLSVGGQFSWQGFYQKKDGVLYSQPGIDVYSNQVRYQNAFEGTFDVRYHLDHTRTVIPYVGFGIGPGYTYQRLDAGLWSITNDEWHFAVRPDLGVLFQFPGSNTGAHISGSYHLMFKTKDTDATTYIGINLGLATFF